MHATTEADKVRMFIRTHLDSTLFSTNATQVEIEEVVYNITGSTKDPKKIRDHEGKNWKELLISIAGLEDASCYVDNVRPGKPSKHPEFSVGGHMTTNPAGEVQEGGTSYLMPLCKWHNNPARNEMAFEHEHTTMLKLTGFMKGDTPLTFMMRLAGTEQRQMLYFDKMAKSWQSRSIDDIEGTNSALTSLSSAARVSEPFEEYAILQKVEGGYSVVKSTVNNVGA